MLNRTKQEAEDFISQNSKAFGGTMTQKEIGLVIGCTGPRVNQMIADMKKETVEPEAA